MAHAASHAWLGVGDAVVPAAITVVALRARSIFLIQTSNLSLFKWRMGIAPLDVEIGGQALPAKCQERTSRLSPGREAVDVGNDRVSLLKGQLILGILSCDANIPCVSDALSA